MDMIRMPFRHTQGSPIVEDYFRRETRTQKKKKVTNGGEAYPLLGKEKKRLRESQRSPVIHPNRISRRWKIVVAENGGRKKKKKKMRFRMAGGRGKKEFVSLERIRCGKDPRQEPRESWAKTARICLRE